MVDTDTFLTTLYAVADDFCKSQPPSGSTPGPLASLTSSEVLTLIIFSQWARFRSERVETVFGSLQHTFGLDRERPRQL